VVQKEKNMGLRILIIGNDSNYLQADADMLHARGLNVYTCARPEVMIEMVDEVKPDILFLNWQTTDEKSTALYNSLLDNVRFAALPIIYTLAEDDVYLVNRRRTTVKENRYITCDNIISAIRKGLTPVASPVKRNYYVQPPMYSGASGAYRA
jgi:response regulator RpfG family c-di-GMP phosphodiesterase